MDSKPIPWWLVFAPLALGAVAYGLVADLTIPFVQFEFAGSAERSLAYAARNPEAFHTALGADTWAFVPGYLVTFLLAASRLRTVLVAVFGGVAAVCDWAANHVLDRALDSGADAGFKQGQILEIATVVAALVAIALLVTSARRRV